MKRNHAWIILLFCLAGLTASSLAQSPPFLWAVRAGGTSYDSATGVATDSAGNVFVTGYQFAKYDSQGVLLRVVETAGSGYSKVAVDAAGDVYVAGSFYVSAGSSGLSVAKYDNAGNKLWSTNATSPDAVIYVNSIAEDRNGNSFVTGHFWRAASFGQVDVTSQNTSANLYLAKYGPNGDCLWVRTAEQSATDSWSVGHGVAVDPA